MSEEPATTDSFKTRVQPLSRCFLTLCSCSDFPHGPKRLAKMHLRVAKPLVTLLCRLGCWVPSEICTEDLGDQASAQRLWEERVAVRNEWGLRMLSRSTDVTLGCD